MRLHERGLKKRRHVDFDDERREAVFREVLAEIAPLLIRENPEVEPRIRAVLGAR